MTRREKEQGSNADGRHNNLKDRVAIRFKRKRKIDFSFSLVKNRTYIVVGLAMEYAVYAKSDAPKLIPSKTNAKELSGCVAATNWMN